MNPKYSICITHYNEAPTIRASLESLLSQIDSNFEIVVVDSKSSDGSEEILREYSRKGMIKLITRRCSRGRGRQIALENSTAAFIIANMDLDDIFRPRLRELLEKYQENCSEDLLWVQSIEERGFWGRGNITIAPRGLLVDIGGWHDLQIGEDWELCRRAAHVGRYRWTYFKLLERANPHPERRTSLGRLKFRYAFDRDKRRRGDAIFQPGDHPSLARRIPLLLAELSLPFYTRYEDSGDSSFEPYPKSCHLDFGESFPPASEGHL